MLFGYGKGVDKLGFIEVSFQRVIAEKTCKQVSRSFANADEQNRGAYATKGSIKSLRRSRFGFLPRAFVQARKFDSENTTRGVFSAQDDTKGGHSFKQFDKSKFESKKSTCRKTMGAFCFTEECAKQK